jgi:hypothetical protein
VIQAALDAPHLGFKPRTKPESEQVVQAIEEELKKK